MAALKDQTICLRTHPYSETSQIVILFGRRYGKVRAIAKGSRRPQRGNPQTLETLSHGQTLFHPARGEAQLATLQSSDAIELWSGLRRDMLGLYAAQLLAELTDQFTADHDPHEILFDALLAALRGLDQGGRADYVLLDYILTLLEAAGLAPQWERCGECGNEPAGTKRGVYFSSHRSTLLCGDCEQMAAEKRAVDFAALSLLRRPETTLNAPAHVVLKGLDLLFYHLREQLGKQTRMMQFIYPLLQQRAKTESVRS